MDSSQSYIYPTSNSNQNPNTRLLWRGSIVSQTGSKFHGLAIVAHSINPKAASQTKHDPFSADSCSHTLKDTCLEIEMLRGRDLQVDKITQIIMESKGGETSSDPEHQIGSRKSRVASLLKGKGNGLKDSNPPIVFSEIDCDPEVRLYVDPRCSQTHNWILSHLGKRELTPAGVTSNALIVRLDPAADDQISSQLVLFGRAVQEQEDLPQPSTSETIIPLQLVIGQHKPPRNQPFPRPDDPMPRVVPSLLSIESQKRYDRKSIGTVVDNANRTTSSRSANPSLVNSFSQNIKSDKNHVTRLDTLDKNITNLNKRSLGTIKRSANTPGRRIKPETDFPREESDINAHIEALECLSPRNSEKRKSKNIPTHSTKKLKTALKATKQGIRFLDPYTPIEEPEIEKGLDEMGSNDFPVDRSPSPSPSPFRYQTNHITDPIPTPDQFNPTPVRFDKHQSNGLLVDSSEPSKSSRVRFLPINHPPSKLQNSSSTAAAREKKSINLLPATKDATPPSHLHQNKMLIRKITTESLNNRGLYKHHPKFKDLFTAVCRGVQFAVREPLETKSIDINLTKTFVESHLAMYMILNSSSNN